MPGSGVHALKADKVVEPTYTPRLMPLDRGRRSQNSSRKERIVQSWSLSTPEDFKRLEISSREEGEKSPRSFAGCMEVQELVKPDCVTKLEPICSAKEKFGSAAEILNGLLDTRAKNALSSMTLEPKTSSFPTSCDYSTDIQSKSRLKEGTNSGAPILSSSHVHMTLSELSQNGLNTDPRISNKCLEESHSNCQSLELMMDLAMKKNLPRSEPIYLKPTLICKEILSNQDMDNLVWEINRKK